jgi:hypothetical protein
MQPQNGASAITPWGGHAWRSLLTSGHATGTKESSMSTRNIAIAALILVVLVILYFAFAG